MKKIKLSGKLNLNKMKISELNNAQAIIGGKENDNSVFVKCGPVFSEAPGCHSTPVCCLSYTCPTYQIDCPGEETGTTILTH